MSADLLVKGGRVVGAGGVQAEDILVRDGRVAERGRDLIPPPRCPVLDAAGKLVFPGLIDAHVHFREPGLEHKEDLASGSLAAVAGGVTSFLEMPNTRPPTVGPQELADKLRRAALRALADHAFFLGASTENAERLAEWERLPGCAGVKVFMGASTGSLLVGDDAALERVLRSGTRRVAVHAEDEARLAERRAALARGALVSVHPHVRDVECALRATRRLLDLAERTGRRVHLLHVSSAEEVALLRERDLGDLVTSEVTTHHLFLAAPECYERLGARVQMNPPIRDVRHQEALRQALVEGVIPCIGSDHAPHTLAEKARPYPESPSGIPGVQTTLPLLLTAVRDGWLSEAQIVERCVLGPAAAFGIRGKGEIAIGADADLVLVDPQERGPLARERLLSRAGYSPYEGVALAGWPVATVLRGAVVWSGGETSGPPRGRPLSFA